MKYYTKEWYALNQRCHYQEDLAVTQSAKRRSEDYFQALYARKLEEHLRFQQEMAALTVDDVFPLDESLEELAIPQENGAFLPAKEALSPEEFANVQAEIRRQIQEARAGWEPEIYDADQAAADFEAQWQGRMAYFQRELPEELLSQVADLRVLALGCCSRKVKQGLAVLSKANEAKARSMVEPYERWMEKHAGGSFPEELLRGYGFHDAEVVALNQTGAELTMELEGGCTDMAAVTWHNARILQQEEGVVGGTWLYEELYPVGKRYEFHALLVSEAGELVYFTVEADGVSFVPVQPEDADEDDIEEEEP